MQVRDRVVELRRVPASELRANPKNWRRHPAHQQRALRSILGKVGYADALLARETEDGLELVDGHLRAETTPDEIVPVLVLDLTDEEADLVLTTLDPLAGMAETDQEQLHALLESVEVPDETLAQLLEDLTGQAGPPEIEARPSLADRFVVPPFSILDQRAGYWQDRRTRWLSLGIRSEIGRGDVGDRRDNRTGGLTIQSLSGTDPDFYYKKTEVERRLGREISLEEYLRDHYTPYAGASGLSSGGTSVFDPVLCELVYRWFSPPDGLVLDPFAGGSVRGIVAGTLGRRYVGIDLSERQIEANREQVLQIAPTVEPEWIVGDARVAPLVEADLVFSCPPYADLERYSDDPRDLSTMKWPEFLEGYREVVRRSVDALRTDRFAVFVVGDVRDPRSTSYRGFVPETIRAFADAGATFYNEAILVNPVGSLPVRMGRQFSVSRKFGKTHQNVLVFCKGDWRAAVAACGEVDVSGLEEFLDPTAEE